MFRTNNRTRFMIPQHVPWREYMYDGTRQIRKWVTFSRLAWHWQPQLGSHLSSVVVPTVTLHKMYGVILRCISNGPVSSNYAVNYVTLAAFRVELGIFTCWSRMKQCLLGRILTKKKKILVSLPAVVPLDKVYYLRILKTAPSALTDNDRYHLRCLTPAEEKEQILQNILHRQIRYCTCYIHQRIVSFSILSQSLPGKQLVPNIITCFWITTSAVWCLLS